VLQVVQPTIPPAFTVQTTQALVPPNEKFPVPQVAQDGGEAVQPRPGVQLAHYPETLLQVAQSEVLQGAHVSWPPKE